MGKNSITYADAGASGVLYNTRLAQAIKGFAVCINNNEEKIKEIAIYNKFIYDALLAEYNVGIRVLKLKEVDNGICAKAEISSGQKEICEAVNEEYLISQAEKAYAISPDIKERKKTKEEIKEDMDNFANINKEIQELEGF